jgi:hypothetical protein
VVAGATEWFPSCNTSVVLMQALHRVGGDLRLTHTHSLAGPNLDVTMIFQDDDPSTMNQN